jgi:biphenyl-2,3-diol 1,2-dioxygenase
VLGVQMLPGPDAHSRLLKLDSQPYRFFLSHGTADDLVVAGWEVADEATLEAFATYLTRIGEAFDWADAALCAQRQVTRMLRVRDPNDVVHEAYTGMAAGAPFVPHLTRGRFLTGDGGLGHIVFGSNHYPASVAFAQRVLGASISDIIKQVITPTVTAHVTFMHVNERHHSIAYVGRQGSRKLHHFMIEVEQVGDVGLARDRHIKTGLAIAQDIGQHPNDRMISYYGATPSGFFVEYGWGGVKVDVANWQQGEYDRMSEWGHRPIVAAAPAAPNPQTVQPPLPVSGKWNLLITTPMGEQPAALVLADDMAGELTALGETTKTYETTLSGDTLDFKADVSLPFPMTLVFSLVITGDSISGEVQPGPMGSAPVTGTRA